MGMQQIFLGSGGGGDIGPLLFPMSRDSSGQKYIHAVKTDGTVLGTFNAGVDAVAYCDFRVGNNYYHGTYNSVIYKTNLQTFATTSITNSNNGTPYGWAPITENKFIAIRYDKYYIMDVDADTVTETTYTASFESNSAQVITTLGFTTFGENLFSTGSYVFSAAGISGSPYSLKVFRHSRSGTTLSSAQEWLNTGANYSRTFGIHDSHGNVDLIIRDDTGHHYLRETAAAGSFTPSLLSGWSQVYNNGAFTFSNHCIADGRWYHYNQKSISTYVYEHALVYQNLDPSASQTVVDTGIRVPGHSDSSSGSYNYASGGTYLTTINTDGYVAIAYWDKIDEGDYLTDRLRIKVIDRNNTVVSNTYVDVGASYTSGNNSNTFGMIGANYVTDTLYSGSTYSE